MRSNTWGRLRESNSRPTHYECVALPSELRRPVARGWSAARRTVAHYSDQDPAASKSIRAIGMLSENSGWRQFSPSVTWRQTGAMRDLVVIGASFAGMLAAAAAARAGFHVTVVERDRLPADAVPRSGVPQSEQAHILLRRGLLAMESLLPGLEQEMLDHGGHPFNTGQLPWLGEFGWLPQTDWSYPIISLSRPLLEHLVRRRVRALPTVEFCEETRVSGLRRTDSGWQVMDHEQVVAAGDVVVDASGRGSRMPHWLGELGVTVPEVTEIEPRLGYASRRYRGSLPLATGAVVGATPKTLAGALTLPVEHDSWIVCAAGYGDRRPGRTSAEFDAFLAALRDPVLAEATRRLEPETEVSVHRQTGNRRHAYGRSPDWPAGLLVVGDALCAFNPTFGQGITVAAIEAAELGSALTRYDATSRSTRSIQRRVSAAVELAWSVVVGEDLRMPTTDGQRNLGQRLIGAWTRRMVRLAVGGDEDCTRTFSSVYHLMGSPWLLVRPKVVAAVVGSLVRGVPPAADRPAELAALGIRTVGRPRK